jgi:hypothetical protein
MTSSILRLYQEYEQATEKASRSMGDEHQARVTRIEADICYLLSREPGGIVVEGNLHFRCHHRQREAEPVLFPCDHDHAREARWQRRRVRYAMGPTCYRCPARRGSREAISSAQEGRVMHPWFVFLAVFAVLISIGNIIRRRRRERLIRELVETLRKQQKPGS